MTPTAPMAYRPTAPLVEPERFALNIEIRGENGQVILSQYISSRLGGMLESLARRCLLGIDHTLQDMGVTGIDHLQWVHITDNIRRLGFHSRMFRDNGGNMLSVDIVPTQAMVDYLNDPEEV